MLIAALRGFPLQGPSTASLLRVSDAALANELYLRICHWHADNWFVTTAYPSFVPELVVVQRVHQLVVSA